MSFFVKTRHVILEPTQVVKINVYRHNISERNTDTINILSINIYKEIDLIFLVYVLRMRKRIFFSPTWLELERLSFNAK